MKKYLLIVLIALLMAVPSISEAAGTIVQTSQRYAIANTFQRCVVTLTCTGDASTGSFPTTGGAIIYPAITQATGFYLYCIRVIPGTTHPTASSTRAITDAYGVPVVGSTLLASMSASAAAQFYPANYPPIFDAWTVTITGNSVASANITILLEFIANI